MEGMTLEKLQVIIEAYTQPYKEELDKIKQKTSTVTSQVERETSKMRNAYRKVAAAAGTVLSIAAITAFGKSCVELGSNLTEVQNVVGVTFGDMNRKVDAFAKNAIKQFGLSELTAKKYIGTYGAMAKAFNITGESGYQMSAAITGLTGDVASFYNLTTDEAFTKLKSIFTGETESLKELGVVMTQTALDQYALNNGFGKTTAKMTEQEKVMLRYQFVMSSLSDASEDFARTSHTWANQVRVLGLQFESVKATIGQGLINAFTPVIRVVNELLAKLQTLAAYFKAFTTALFGDANGGTAMSGAADSLASAAGSSGAIADNMNAAAGAAKKMKEYTLGIDELNVLNPENNSGGAGDIGGAGVPDFGSMSGTLFGDVSVNPEIEAATDRIRQAVEKLKETAQPTTDALNRLWEDGLAKLGNFSWTALRDFWDYFLVPLGTWALGDGFPRFVDITNEFLGKINWDEINDALREFWKALEPFAENVGEGLLDFYEGLLAVGSGFINTVVPGGLRGLAKALEGIDAKTANDIGAGIGAISIALPGLKVAGIVSPMVKDLGEAIRNFPGMTAVGGIFGAGGLLDGIANMAMLSGGPGTAAFDVLGNKFIDIFDQFILENFGESTLNAMANGLTIAVGAGIGGIFFGPIGAFVGGFAGLLVDAIADIDWSGDVLGKIKEKLFNYDRANELAEQANAFFEKAFNAENFVEFGSNIIAGVGAGMASLVHRLIEPITDLFDFVIEKICDIFGIHSPARELEPYGEYILLGIIEGFRGTFAEWGESMDEWFNLHIAPWFTTKKWSDLYQTIKTELGNTWTGTVTQWKSNVSSWWSSHVSPWFTIAKWKTLYDTIKSQLGEKWDETLGEWQTNLTSWWNEDVSPWFTIAKWLELYDSIRSSLGETWAQTSEKWKLDIDSWWKNDVSAWFTLEKWTGIMAKVPDAFKDIFKGAVNAAVSQLNKLIDWINDKLNFEFDGLEILGEEIIPSFSIQLFTIPHIPEFASGGIANSGQLFIANEAGPELIGRYGSRAGVMNNDQIVSAVSEGVATAVANVMAAYEGSDESNQQIELTVNLDGRTVSKSVHKAERRGGFKFRTV